MQNIPRVVLAINNQKQVVQQSYDNIQFEINTGNKPSPVFYNECISKHNTAIYGFLDDYHQIIHPKAIEIIVETLQNTHGIVGVFTDHYIVSGKATKKYNTLPAFNAKIYGNLQNIVNVALFLNINDNNKLFDEDLHKLYFYDVIHRLSQNFTLYHIAMPLIAVYNKEIDVQQDIIMLNKKYATR